MSASRFSNGLDGSGLGTVGKWALEGGGVEQEQPQVWLSLLLHAGSAGVGPVRVDWNGRGLGLSHWRQGGQAAAVM